MNSSAGDDCYQTHENLTLKGSFLSPLCRWFTEVKWILFQRDTFWTKNDVFSWTGSYRKAMVTAVSTQALLRGWCLSPKKNQFIKYSTFFSVSKYPNSAVLVCLVPEHAGSLCHPGSIKIHPGRTTGTWKEEERYRHIKNWNKETLSLPILVKIK